MIRFDPDLPTPTDVTTGATPPTDDLFDDADEVDVDDLDVPVSVAAGAPAVLKVARWAVHATKFAVVSGRLAPGQTVRLRATEVVAYAPKGKQQRPAGRPRRTSTFALGPGQPRDLRDRPANAAERQSLRWRVHCGGTWLPRPDAVHPLVVGPARVHVDKHGVRHEAERQELPPVLDGIGDELTLTLPATLNGQTLVLATWGPGQQPAVNTHVTLRLEGPQPAGHGVTTAAQIAAVMRRRLPVRSARLAGESARFLDLCDWLLRLLPESGLSPLQQAHFLAQVYLETGRMTALVEGKTGDALTAKWHKQFPKRSDEGVPESTFRGRGLMQVTWAENYQRYFRSRGESLLPRRELAERAALLAEPEHAVRSALWYWSRPGHNPAEMAAVDDVWGVSMRVNGFNRPSYIPNGYPVRVAALVTAKRVLGLLT